MAKFTSNRSGLDALQKALKNADKKQLQAGWFEGAKYNDNTPVAAIAAQNEYGNAARNIPPRPFMRQTVESNQSNWNDMFRQGARAMLDGKETIDTVLNRSGLKITADIKNSIVSGSFAANNTATIQRKGHSDPLRDSGVMLATITHEVS